MNRYLSAFIALLLSGGVAFAVDVEGEVMIVTPDKIVIKDAKGVFHDYDLSDRVKMNLGRAASNHLLRDMVVGQTIIVCAGRKNGVYIADGFFLVRDLAPAPRPKP